MHVAAPTANSFYSRYLEPTYRLKAAPTQLSLPLVRGIPFPPIQRLLLYSRYLVFTLSILLAYFHRPG